MTTQAVNDDRFPTIPDTLKQLDRWLLWREEERNGQATKVPKQPTGRLAKSTDSRTWCSYDQAMIALCYNLPDDFDGLGFALGDGIAGIDLDHCRDPETGEIAPWAREIIDALDSYTEVSPSGDGLHVLVCANLGDRPGNRTPMPDGGELEIYWRGRYFTVTGEHLEGTPTTVEERQAELTAVHEEHIPDRATPDPTPTTETGTVDLPDEELLRRMFASKTGAKAKRLWNGDWSGYPSESEADQALCNILAFWTAKDPARMDRLFRQSGLYRADKWDRIDNKGNLDYRDRTIGKALADTSEVYTPPAPGNDGEPARGRRNLSDLGNSYRLVDHHGEDLRHCHPWDKWLVWDGTCWREDDAGLSMAKAKTLPRIIYREASDCSDKDRRDALAKHAHKTESRSRLANALALARSEVPILPDDLNCNPWLLNVENGTIDLQTGEIRDHRREDLLTQLAPVAYDPDARCPQWEVFLQEIMCGHDELPAFLRRAVGYSLTGDVREDALFFLHGNGSNGKTTFIHTILRLLGPLGTQAASDLLMASRYGQHPTAVADLFGKRFVATIEPDEGRHMAESLTKQLTGGDRVKARRMREDFWEFEPTHKIWLAANHKPRIRGGDDGIWRRIMLIPFDAKFEGEDRDLTLEDTLVDELPGILNWALRGCAEWQKDGLNVPDTVRGATDDYRFEEDDLGRFFREETIEDERMTLKFSDLWKRYQDWCEENREDEISKTMMGRELTSRGYEKDESKHGAYRSGIGLRNRDEGRRDEDGAPAQNY